MSESALKEQKSNLKNHLLEMANEEMKQSEEFLRKVENIDHSSFASAKEFYALYALHCGAVSTQYKLFENAYGTIFILYDVIMHLEKVVRDIAEKSEVDLSSMKSQLDQLNTAINGQTIAKVASFLEEVEKASQRTKKEGETYLV